MAKSSFKKGAVKPDAKPVPQTAALVPATPAHIANPHDSGVQGEVDNSDFVIPSFKLVQSIGPMSENFEPGAWVVNGEVPVTEPDDKAKVAETPLVLGFIKAKKMYRENVDYEGEERARYLDTMEQVRAVGGHLDWIDNQRPPFSPCAQCLVVVKAPEGLPDEALVAFPFIFESKDKADKPFVGNWALCLYEAKSTQYTRVGKPLFTACELGDLRRKGLNAGCWALGSKREKLGKNLVWVPVFKRHTTPDFTPGFIEWMKSLA